MRESLFAVVLQESKLRVEKVSSCSSSLVQASAAEGTLLAV